jgi:5-methyltetrahydropteroyltriglutamate--homocysteine methyltransferase
MSVRTTTVGSWWPREEYAQPLRDHHAGRLTPEESERVLHESAAAAVAEQQALGLTEWTGGEYFTDEFLNHMQSVLTGIEIDVPSKEELFDYDDFAHAKITGDISAPQGMGYAAAYLRERDLPGGVPKAAVVGPLEMAFNAIDQLPQLTAQLSNLIDVVRNEILELVAAGCDHVQLDVPTFSTLMSMDALTADEAASIIADCFEGVTGVRRGIHICSGNMRGRPLSGDLHCAPWMQILERPDGVIDVAHLALQYFIRYLERDAFAVMPASIELAAGIVDEGCYAVEPVWKIRERAADWARVVGEERLWLAPSCGFGRHPARDVPVLRAKMENMVEAAAKL